MSDDQRAGPPEHTLEQALEQALRAARARIAAAETAVGRAPGSVRLLLATKTLDATTVRAAVAADARVADELALPHALLGENRVQELVAKAPELADLADPSRPTWHVIGPLQSNKVNAALRFAACVESVDDLGLAERLARRCEAVDRELDVLVQVNVSGEATKSGVHPDAAADLAAAVAGLERLHLRGFMTIGLRSADVGAVRAGFARLRAVRDEVVASGVPGTAEAHELSMGMSADLEPAVAEGATVVRLGTAVFGPRG